MFFNCQQDDFIEEGTVLENAMVIKRINNAELKRKVPKVYNSIKALNEDGTSQLMQRNESEDNQYVINTDDIIEITQNGLQHYTFSISRTIPSDLVENLVLTTDPEGLVKGKIVTYDFTMEEKLAIELNNYVDLADKMSIKEVENINNVTAQFMRTGLECLTFNTVGGPVCPSSEHHDMATMLSGGCTLVNEGSFTPSSTTVVQIIVDTDCLNGGDAGGGNSTPTNPDTPPINPSAGGGGGSPSPNPVVTTPLLEVRNSLLPCAKLKKMSNSIPNYDQNINHLKNKAEGTKEYAWAYKYHSETDSFSPGIVVGDDQSNSNKVDLGNYLGGDYIGAAHNHLNPELTDGIAMFSPGDIGWLFNCARKHNNNGQPKDYSLYFLLMVVEGRNYALKITDAAKFQLNFNAMYSKIKKDLTEAYLKSTQYADAFTLQKDLLNVLKTHDVGVGLFEETEINGSKEWSELVLDPIYPSANPIKKPCN